MAFPQVGVAAVVEGVNSFLRDMGKMDSAVQGTADKTDQAGGKIGKVGSKLAGFGKAAGAAALTGVAALGAAVVGIGVVSLKTAIEFDSAWAGVVKTTDGLVDEFGNLTEAGEEMQGEFRGLAKTVPIAVEELLEIGELGGQLGVASEDLIGFTEVIAAMGVSTNLSTDEAATGLARLANVMGTTESEGSAAFSKLGSTIVALGNNSATTEADILNFASRMAGAAEVAGVTEADMLGISAAFSSVGIQAQAGGTAVSKVFLGMNKAALEGGEAMEIFAATAGLGADEFGAAWEEDAGAVFGEFVKGLGMAGDDAISILDALEIKDSQAVRAFLSLAGAGDLVTESMTTANVGWDENTALATEAATRYATTESQMILLKNTLKDVAITIGQFLLPAFNNLLQAAIPLISELGKKLSGTLNDVLIPAIEKVGSAFSNLVKRLQGRGIGAFLTIFEDGSSILSAFFRELGLGEKAAQSLAKSIINVIKPIVEFSQAALAFAQQHGPAIRNAIIAIGAAFAAAAIVGAIAGIIVQIIALLNPVTLVIAAIALLAAAWTENWFGIRDVVMEVLNGVIIPAFLSLVEFITNVLIPAFVVFGEFLVSVLTPIIQAFVDFMIAMFTIVRDWVIANWPLIQQTIQTVLTAIQAVVQSAMGAVAAFWAENGAQIMATVEGVWLTIKTIVETTINTVLAIITAAMQAINGDWDAAWTTIENAASTAWKQIQTGIETVLGFIKDTVIPAALSAIEALFAAAWKGIQLSVETAIDGMKITINNGLKAARVVIDFIMASIESTIASTWASIPDIFKEGIEKAKNFITGAVSAFGAAGAAIVDAIREGIEGAWDGLLDGLQGKLNDLADMLPFSEPKNPRSPLRGLAKSGMSIVKNISAGLADAMPMLQAQLGAAINPTQQSGPVTNFGGNVTNISRDITVEVISNPASQPSEQAIFFDVSAALSAARGG